MNGSTRGRRQKRQRQEVLAAAADLLLERGLDGFSLRELARRTDYTPGALYNFFPGKDALLEELTGQVFDRFGAYLADVPRDLPAAQRLLRLSEAYMRFARENPEEYLLLFTRIPAPGSTTFDDPAAAPRPWLHLIEACRDATLAGELRARDEQEARLAFFQFFCVHHGLAMLRLTRMKELPDGLFEGLSSGVRQTFVAGLLATTPATRPGQPTQVTRNHSRKEQS